MSFIVKHLAKARTLTVANRCVNQVHKAGGHVYKIESMGLQDLPQRMHGDSKGSYFVVQYVAPTASFKPIISALRLDRELLRRTVFILSKNKPHECTLHDELKPPIHRKEVQLMIKEADLRKPKVVFPMRNLEVMM
ncbi:Ribosomal protein S6 [Trinorchestia longiramus]|nr:Ribosomal protein S6 [Trinorchestia longiramus]